jgi:hypothetical protein
VERSDTHRVTMLKTATIAGLSKSRPGHAQQGDGFRKCSTHPTGYGLADVRVWVRKINNLPE